MTLLEALSMVKDPRREQGMRTDLAQIFCMVVLSYLCGYKGYRPVGKFSKLHEELFIKELSLRHGVPSYVTFREVIMRVDEAELIEAFNKWSETYVPLEKESWVSGDGKVLGSTVVNPNGKGQDFEAVVSLFCQKSGLVRALEHYRNKTKETGEGSIARFLIEKLRGMGIIFSLDALHTQKKRLT